MDIRISSFPNAVRYEIDYWAKICPSVMSVRYVAQNVYLPTYYRTDKCFGRKIINYFGRRKFKEIIFLRRRNVKTDNNQ
jgi:hypothetical protein